MGESARQPGIVVVTRNFPPILGGMERLNWHLVDELTKHFDVQLVGPAGALRHVPDGVRAHGSPLTPLWRFLLTAGWQTLRQAGNSKPRVVLAGSGLTAPLAWLAARRSGAQAISYVHGLDISVPHPVYRALWWPVLRRMDRVIANSHATAALAKAIGIPAARIGVVHPGVRLPAPDSDARARFRAAHGLGNAPVLLSVGRLTQRKGLREFVADVLPRIIAARPDVHLVILGDAPVNALYGGTQTPDSIREVANGTGAGARLHFLGRQSEQNLTDAYAAADVHVFPVRHIPDDPEGFGMVAVEAAAHGLQTVAYATGGVTEAVADGISGQLISPGDSAGFAQAVLRLLAAPLPADGIRAYAGRFEWAHFGALLAQEIESCDT
ncbi:MAG: glycosyltransferase family 4 protein [Acidiferrobacterales bacterium]